MPLATLLSNASREIHVVGLAVGVEDLAHEKVHYQFAGVSKRRSVSQYHQSCIHFGQESESGRKLRRSLQHEQGLRCGRSAILLEAREPFSLLWRFGRHSSAEKVISVA